MDVFVAVEFAPEVDSVGSVYLGKEDDGDAGGAGGGHNALRVRDQVGLTVHESDTGLLGRQRVSALDIDGDQDGSTRDDRGRVCHLTSLLFRVDPPRTS